VTETLTDRARLEAALLSRRRRRTSDAIPVLPRDGGPLVVPAAPSQEGMWAEAHDETAAAPIILAGVRLRGRLDVDVLTRALGGLIARHETLRTVLRPGEGGLSQVVAPAARPDLPVVPSSLAEFPEVTWAEADRRFDLERGPLFRLRVLRAADDDHIALLVLHHIIGDARSLEIFIRDLIAYYVAFRDGGEPDLPALPVQYADFAQWFRRRLAGPRRRQLIDYWVRRLAGAVPAALPADLAPPAAGPMGSVAGSVRGDTLRLPIGPGVIAAAAELARQCRATLHMVGCAAFQVLLARYSGQRDIAVRVPISYRDRREVQDLIADFSNDIVFRVDLSGNPTFAELVGHVRDAAADDFSHHDLPPHLLAPELGDPGLLGRLFQVQFSTESDPSVELPLGELRAEPMPPPWQYAFRPLALRIRLTPGGADCIATYRTAVFSRGRVTDLVHDYLDLLAELAGRPDQRVFGGPGAPARPPLRVPPAPGGG
jgi:hypothetical protein